jgi:hypothetical protein
MERSRIGPKARKNSAASTMERPRDDLEKGVNDMAAKKKKKRAAASKGSKTARKRNGSRAASARAAGKKAPARKGKAGKARAKSAGGKSKVKKAGKKSPARAVKKARKNAGGRTARPAGKKQVMGEGDYAASRSFLKDQGSFVERHRSDIPAMGKEAEQALEGPQGDSLRDAEATAAARSRDTF